METRQVLTGQEQIRENMPSKHENASSAGSATPLPVLSADAAAAWGVAATSRATSGAVPACPVSAAPKSESLTPGEDSTAGKGSASSGEDPTSPHSEHDKTAKTDGLVGEEEAPTLKASIYFKLSGGRTRNRTFPGDVNKHGRELLQEWSRQFRYGLSCAKKDVRKVFTSAKRNGTLAVDRATAFGWFRKSQIKYSDLFYYDEEDDTALQITQLRNAGITDHNTIQALKVNRFISGKKRRIKLPPVGTKISQFTPNVYHHHSNKNEGNVFGDRTEFVEIVWESYKHFNNVPTTFFLMFGMTKVYVYTHESGRGKL